MVTPALETRADEDQWLWQSFRYHSRTFSLATRLLPESVQMAVATLYLYCRRVDSVADQRILEVGPQRALDEVRTVRDRLDATLAGNPPADAVLWRRLAEVHAEHDLSEDALHELIRGAIWDLEKRPIETRNDLVDYSNLVGGSVGAMMLPFLADADRHEQLDGPARRLGIAMQITNIVRDVGEDLDELDRIYLPSTWLDEFDVAVDDLESHQVVPGYIRLLERTMETAEEFYDTGFEGADALSFQFRVGIKTAARMYREIMNEVRANQYDNLTNRAFVSFGRKLSLLVYDGYERRKRHLRAEHAPPTTHSSAE